MLKPSASYTNALCKASNKAHILWPALRSGAPGLSLAAGPLELLT